MKRQVQVKRIKQIEEKLKNGYTYPIYIETLNVTKGIDGVVVENMTKPQTGCLHDYQMTPADTEKLENADVFIANGAGMESFLQDVIDNQKNFKVVEAAKASNY